MVNKIVAPALHAVVLETYVHCLDLGIVCYRSYRIYNRHIHIWRLRDKYIFISSMQLIFDYLSFVDDTVLVLDCIDLFH